MKLTWTDVLLSKASILARADFTKISLAMTLAWCVFIISSFLLSKSNSRRFVFVSAHFFSSCSSAFIFAALLVSIQHCKRVQNEFLKDGTPELGEQVLFLPTHAQIHKSALELLGLTSKYPLC